MWLSTNSCPTSAFNQLTSQSMANIGSQQAVRKMTRYFLSPLLHIPSPQSPPQMHNSTHHMVPCSATGGQFITVTLSFCREHKASDRLFRVLPAWVLSAWSICDIKYSDQHCPVNFLNKRFLGIIFLALWDLHSTSVESFFYRRNKHGSSIEKKACISGTSLKQLLGSELWEKETRCIQGVPGWMCQTSGGCSLC